MEPVTKLKPDFYREVINESAGLKGYIVVHRQANGIATGGIRMAPNVTLDEIANLAYEMTMKYAFFKIKKDGAKAGITTSGLETDEQKKVLRKAFGEEINDLIGGGKYFPGQDLGTNAADLQEILFGAGIHFVKRKDEIDSAYFTAFTVYLTLREILSARNRNIKETSFIIEGFGKVGEHLAKLVFADGGKILGLSTVDGAVFDARGLDVIKMSNLKAEYGDRAVKQYDKDTEIPKEELFSREADVFIPGARPDSINPENAGDLKFKVIVPIANIAATQEVEQMLYKREIIFVPGFVSNAGGILSYYFSEQRFDNETVKDIILNGFSANVGRLIAEAKDRGRSIPDVARERCSHNMQLVEKERNMSFIEKTSLPRMLWMFYKFLAKVKADALLRKFAVKYITNRHF